MDFSCQHQVPQKVSHYELLIHSIEKRKYDHLERKINYTVVDSRRCVGCERSCIPATTIYDESAFVSTLNTSKRSEH
jgi:hypothetical protein